MLPPQLRAQPHQRPRPGELRRREVQRLPDHQRCAAAGVRQASRTRGLRRRQPRRVLRRRCPGAPKRSSSTLLGRSGTCPGLAAPPLGALTGGPGSKILRPPTPGCSVPATRQINFRKITGLMLAVTRSLRPERISRFSSRGWLDSRSYQQGQCRLRPCRMRVADPHVRKAGAAENTVDA